MCARRVLGVYKDNAKYRGIEWSLSDERFFELIQGDCHYCGSAPTARIQKGLTGSFVCNGVDRKDSSIGYVEGNVVPCCKFCQYGKRNFPYDKFVAYLLQAGHFQAEKQLPLPV